MVALTTPQAHVAMVTCPVDVRDQHDSDDVTARYIPFNMHVKSIDMSSLHSE